MESAYRAQELKILLGISIPAIHNRAKKRNWRFEERPNPRGGGTCKLFVTSSMDPDTQKTIAEKTDATPVDLIPTLAPEAALVTSAKTAAGELPTLRGNVAAGAWSAETALDTRTLTDPRVQRIARIVQEALAVPNGWKKRKWVEAVAAKHDTSWQTIYKWLKKYEKRGLAGFAHRKNTRGKARAWTHEAIDWWVGLCLKRAHRKMAKDALYAILEEEARTRGWRIGTYSSALDWFNKKVSPQLLALQRGGARALDNTLPPVLRNYSDLAPFELLVGDQHRWDFWVVDDDTGVPFRPEGYYWQDLRTRMIYGGAVDKKYDAHLCGLALRIGCRIFGAFGSIYTDNGRPELSRYIMNIMAGMRTLGMHAERTVDGKMDTGGLDGEAVNPCVILPGTHKKAIVKNAKAKMIEGTFNVLEGIMRDHMAQPGYVKKLGGDPNENDVDMAEIERLAAQGKLPTFSEFVLTMYQAMDYYNKQKAHRGVLREWVWKPRPKSVTPEDCLRACVADGWRPRRVSEEAIDLLFLTRVPRGRVVDKGRVLLSNVPYEATDPETHEILTELHGTRVDVRYDPMDPLWVLIFHGDDFICRAEPVEYSSMKDSELAGRKIEEKRRLRKAFVERYRELTRRVPDIREFSKTPVEVTARRVEAAKQKQIAERSGPVRTADELAADVARIEGYKQEIERPIFHSAVDRYTWCIDQMAEGVDLATADRAFMTEHEAGMGADTAAYWNTYKNSLLGGRLKAEV